MKQLIFATTNNGKVKEIRSFLNLDHVQFLSLNDIQNYPFPEPVEDGKTFIENAKKKADHYFKILNKPLIADDSGLVVPALYGEPGIYSARYAGSNASDNDNNNLLLEKLKSFPPEDRKAYFKAVLIYKDKDRELSFEGKCWGQIIMEPKGDKGFGYDPLFYIKKLQKTFAELGPIEKNKFSHRGKAVDKFKKYFTNSLK